VWGLLTVGLVASTCLAADGVLLPWAEVVGVTAVEAVLGPTKYALFEGVHRRLGVVAGVAGLKRVRSGRRAGGLISHAAAPSLRQV